MNRQLAGKIALAGAAVATAVTAGIVIYKNFDLKPPAKDVDPTRLRFPEPREITELDVKITELSKHYSAAAQQMLIDLIKLPAAHREADPHCGESNHEGLRLEYLKQRIEELHAVFSSSDIHSDDLGNLIWVVSDPNDPTPLNDRRIIYLAGHIDTFPAFPLKWPRGLDAFDGLVDPASIDESTLPPRDQWDSLIFGRGSSSPLPGIVSQVFATKILLETCELGSLRGVQVVSIASVRGESHEGLSSRSITQSPHLEPHSVPDCVILTAPTGDLSAGPCAVYIGGRGRASLTVVVTGPNPVDAGSLIVAEAGLQPKADFAVDGFLGSGQRTVTCVSAEGGSKCAVPQQFIATFDRRLVGSEDGAGAVRELEVLRSVSRARIVGCDVRISVEEGEEYRCWMTPPNNTAIEAAVESYKRTISVGADPPRGVGSLKREARIGRWVGRTQGPGWIFKNGEFRFSIERKNWVAEGEWVHPPMFGIGAGFEEHVGTLGEYVYKDQIWGPIAVIARFPSVFRDRREERND
jgi:acetylornithine deacetylase/succinyl-diaminopimelate desuccinylase-like protein